MLMTLFYVLCGIAVIFAALYYLRGPLLGMVVTFAVQLGLRKAFRVFKLGSFNIIPFVMLEFSVTTHATRKSPEIHVSWKSFRILMDFSKIFDPLLSLLNVLPTSTDKNSILRNKMIRFVFVGFTASSPGLSFADLLDPPENKMPPPEGMTNENGDPVISGDNNSSGAISYMLIMKRLMQHIVLFVDFEFEDFSFDFQFPSHESRMVGSAKLMTISFPRPPSGSADTVSVLNSIDGGEMEITQSDQRAMYYIGQEGKISVDMHLPTGVMDVLMRVLGREHDQMYVAIAPFMEFYRRYTHAEDNSVEIKMARGLSTGGKMSMRLECEYIDVFVTDHRCPDMLRMTMQQLEGELKTYSLTRANERIYKEMRYIEQSDANSSMNDVRHKLYNFFMRDKDADSIVMSPNKEKVMKAGIKRLDFHTNCVESTAFVEEASMIKTKRVFNENDFVDHDRMNGYAKQIHFEKISPALLDWLVVLQDAANRMPDSRFAHKKNSEMHFLGTSFLFSSQPVSFAYTPPPLDSKQPQQQQQQQELFDPPLEKLESIPVEDRHWCCFKFTEMEATRELPYNEVDSLIDLKSAQFEMETSLPQHCLAGQYTLSAIGDSDSDGSSSGGDAQSQGSAHSSSAIDEFYEAHECDIAEITMDRHPFSLTDIYGNKDEDDGVDLGAHLLSEGVSTYYPKISLPHIEGNIETSTAKNCSPRSPSPEQLNDQSERQSKTAAHLKSSTGTMWAFPGFTVRMKLGAKMNLEWVKARLMKIDFLNNPTGDVLVSESSAVDSAGRPVVMRDPFLLTSKLCALWCGPSVTCDLGSMQLQGSAAGVLKAQTGFLMLRKTADRITARMTYMKLRGGPPVVAQPSYHIPGTADCSGVHPEPAAQAKTTVRIDDFIIDVPVEISAEDHEKRMHHELDREQRQILRNQQLLEKFRSKRRNSQSSELYDTVDTEMPLVIPLPSPFSSTDRSDKALKFVMTNFEYSSSVGESTAAFETCKVTINSYPEKPWMVMAGLKYRKAVVPLDINDAFYQGLDLQGSVEAAAISDKTVTEVFMESFDMHLSARMEIGIIADSLLAQDAAFKIASAPPKRNALSLRASPASGAYSEDTHEVIYESGSLSPGPERGGVCLGDSPRGYWENTSGATWSSTSRSRERFGSDTTADLEASFAVSRHQLAMEIPPSEEAETTWEQELNAVAQEDAGLLIKPNPTTMHVIFKCYRIIYDAHYNNDYIEDFMTVEQMGFDLTLDSTKMPSAMQDEITGLDLGAEEDQRKGTPSEVKVDKSEGINTACASDSESLLVYTSVFGGQLKFIVKYLKVRLKLLKDPFVEAEDLVFSGPIYNASVMHPNIVKAEVLVALGDSVPYYSFDDLDSGSLEDGAGVAGRTEERGGAKQIERVRFQPSAGLSVALMGSTEPLYVVLVRSSAPAKVYMDMSMSSSTMDICMNASTQECINAINAVMDCVVPPNKDPSPQFVPWDTWRYLLHGSFTCSFAKMSVQYSSHDFMTQKVTLLVSIDALTWYMDKGSFSLTAQNILVEAQISTALLAGRRNQLKKQRQHLEVSKLCSIPAFVLSLTHFRDDIRTKFLSQSEVRDACSVIPTDHSSCTTYSHHDVYLRPAFDSPFPAEDSTGLGLEDYKYLANDKYFHFRSRLMSIRWEIEMRLADREDVPISFNVRLDHLVRVIDAFKTPEEELAQQPDLVDCCLDKASDYFYGVVRPLSPIPIGDMVSVLKLQLILNKIMISSWPSATNLGGIVMTIGSSDLQLRMLRDVSPEFTVLPPSASAGKTTTRSVRRNSLSSYDDDRSVLSELASLPIFPLKIDHFFMDTAFIELYVRSWHLGPASAASVESPLNSRMFSSYRASALGERK